MLPALYPVPPSQPSQSSQPSLWHRTLGQAVVLSPQGQTIQSSPVDPWSSIWELGQAFGEECGQVSTYSSRSQQRREAGSFHPNSTGSTGDMPQAAGPPCHHAHEPVLLTRGRAAAQGHGQITLLPLEPLGLCNRERLGQGPPAPGCPLPPALGAAHTAAPGTQPSPRLQAAPGSRGAPWH